MEKDDCQELVVQLVEKNSFETVLGDNYITFFQILYRNVLNVIDDNVKTGFTRDRVKNPRYMKGADGQEEEIIPPSGEDDSLVMDAPHLFKNKSGNGIFIYPIRPLWDGGVRIRVIITLCVHEKEAELAWSKLDRFKLNNLWEKMHSKILTKKARNLVNNVDELVIDDLSLTPSDYDYETIRRLNVSFELEFTMKNKKNLGQLA